MVVGLALRQRNWFNRVGGVIRQLTLGEEPLVSAESEGGRARGWPLPSAPVVTQTLWFWAPAAKRILLEAVRILKAETAAFFPVSHRALVIYPIATSSPSARRQLIARRRHFQGKETALALRRQAPPGAIPYARVTRSTNSPPQTLYFRHSLRVRVHSDNATAQEHTLT